MSRLPAKKVTGWRLFLKTILARAYPRVIGQQRDTSWMLFDVLMPFGSMVAYVLVYKAIGAPQEYIGFVVMGGAMTAFWMNILWSMSSQLYWEKETGNLALYIIAPSSMMAILLGMALGGLVATTLRALVITVAGSLMFHVQYQIASYWQLFTVFVLDNGRLVWDGHDAGFAFPAVRTRSLAHGEPGPGTGVPGIRFLLPDQVIPVLGGSRGFDHPAHPGHGRHAAAGFPLRIQDRISYRGCGDRRPAGAYR